MDDNTSERKENREITFSDSVIHVLRNTITPIIGYLDLLKDEARDEQMIMFINSVEDCVESLNRFIEGLFSLYSLATEDIKINAEWLDVDQLVSETVERIETDRIERDIPSGLEIKADKKLIRKALEEVFLNALEYSDEPVDVSAIERANDVLIAIKDAGIGIPEDDRERIFKSFYVASSKKLTRPSDRLGIGLSIARHCIVLNGGKIWVESEPRKGSTFYFTIPKSDNRG